MIQQKLTKTTMILMTKTLVIFPFFTLQHDDFDHQIVKFFNKFRRERLIVNKIIRPSLLLCHINQYIADMHAVDVS